MNDKKISVVIPSYNSSDTIGDCIRSVFATGYPNLEIIVVDDHSTDNSPKIIRSFEEVHTERLIFVAQETNSGPAKARNRGAREAKGEYLFFLDCDTQMIPDTLDRFVETISDADAVTGIYDWVPLNDGLVPRYKALLNCYFFSRKGLVKYEVFDSSRAGIKKSVFDQIGGFNETLTWGMDYENEEFGYRLVENHINLLAPQVRVKHTFPRFRQLTTNYFFRVAFWMEMFLTRHKFESAGVTSVDTGLSSICLLLSLVCIPPLIFSSYFLLPILIFFMGYLYGYIGFYIFVRGTEPRMVPAVVLCNIFFTAVIACGAVWGMQRGLRGAAKNHFSKFN